MGKLRLEWDFHELTEFGSRLNDASKLDVHAQQMAKELARVLQGALFINTPVLTGNLCASWGGKENYSYIVQRVGKGYRVTLKNNGANDRGFRYGLAVNDGHRTPSGSGWVMGRFFVEASVLQTANSMQVEQSIMRQLQKWWDSV